MTTKKVLLMVGLVAAIGIAWWAFNGTPVEDGEEGAIGAANRYRAEQISDSDVQLEDAEVIALLQDDVFLELIQDEDFQTLMARDDVASLMARDGVAGLYRGATPSAILSHRDVVSLAARDDVSAFFRSPAVQAAFDKSWKLSGEGETKDGRIGRSGNVWSKSQIATLEKQLVQIATEKKYKFADISDGSGGGGKGKGQLQARDAVALLMRPAVLALSMRPDVMAELGRGEYVELAKSWKLSGEGETKDGRIGRSGNVWNKYDVQLAKSPHIATLNKSWKLSGEGETKDGRIGRSGNVWARYGVDLQKANVEAALLNRDTVAFFARPDVALAMRDMVKAGSFRSENIQATLGRFGISGPPTNDGSDGTDPSKPKGKSGK